MAVVCRSALAVLAVVAACGCALRDPGARSDGALGDYVGQVRELAVRARPESNGGFAATVEGQDPALAAALLELAAFPAAAVHRRAADRFRDLGILDKAYDHYASARTLDPADAEAYEGLARIWRDWGFPHLGLADASRSVYYGPSRPSSHNTLGTLLAALGRGAEARRSYERALALDPAAAYVLNNLCYLSFLEGEIPRAVAECARALVLDPSLVAARNNLALAYAADRRDDLSRREFLAAGTQAAGLYNIGIVHLAEKRYARAVEAFEAAHRHRPSWAAARRRAGRARALAALSPARPTALVSAP
jgi:Flp pilus assembly protein TadD